MGSILARWTVAHEELLLLREAISTITTTHLVLSLVHDLREELLLRELVLLLLLLLLVMRLRRGVENRLGGDILVLLLELLLLHQHLAKMGGSTMHRILIVLTHILLGRGHWLLLVLLGDH